MAAHHSTPGRAWEWPALRSHVKNYRAATGDKRATTAAQTWWTLPDSRHHRGNPRLGCCLAARLTTRRNRPRQAEPVHRKAGNGHYRRFRADACSGAWTGRPLFPGWGPTAPIFCCTGHRHHYGNHPVVGRNGVIVEMAVATEYEADLAGMFHGSGEVASHPKSALIRQYHSARSRIDLDDKSFLGNDLSLERGNDFQLVHAAQRELHFVGFDRWFDFREQEMTQVCPRHRGARSDRILVADFPAVTVGPCTAGLPPSSGLDPGLPSTRQLLKGNPVTASDAAREKYQGCDQPWTGCVPSHKGKSGYALKKMVDATGLEPVTPCV